MAHLRRMFIPSIRFSARTLTLSMNQFGKTLEVLERKAWPGTSHADSVHVHYLGTKVGRQGKGSGRALLKVAQTIADDEKAACAIEATLPVVRFTAMPCC